jgi:hypothetical protein
LDLLEGEVLTQLFGDTLNVHIGNLPLHKSHGVLELW